ncbi:hypothetical protein LTS18_007366 [Coniosporium uncinatum]|uniref:Uncharacterized protein n=1 Tax=Coniosporium uncinatum TaxID=93489 RepID=A0ACC3D2P4_9PEZI|nr:hypothetical protein LTS18_007366 [Coniosporium uncinatum]
MASAAARPTILLVPGAWHTPAHLAPLVAALKQRDWLAEAYLLPCDGPNAANWQSGDDVKGIHGRLEQLIEAEGKEVVLVGHSYAGAPTSQSVKGFEKHERQAQGKSGGIVRYVIISAQIDLPSFIRAEGILLHPLPGVAQHCYNDLPESEQEKWFAECVPHSALAPMNTAKNTCWDTNVPKTYIVALKDMMLPTAAQEAMLARVKDETWTVERLDSGHSPFLSQIEKCVEILTR